MEKHSFTIWDRISDKSKQELREKIGIIAKVGEELSGRGVSPVHGGSDDSQEGGRFLGRPTGQQA